MSQATSIEWTDVSWNPVHGCSKVSPGCAHCYAETLSRRYGFTTRPWTPANAGDNVILKPHKLREPLSGARAWQGLGAAAAAAGKTEGKLVFVNSMSDLFHELVPDEYIAQVFSVMANAYEHTFQVLTKRPERMRRFVRRLNWSHPIETSERRWRAFLSPDDHWTEVDEPSSPLPNVWLGVSIENRRFVHRADVLRETPAAVRFISAEPLLGPLLGAYRYDPRPREIQTGAWEDQDAVRWLDDYEGPELDLESIDWLIVGGESGPGHRALDLGWVRNLRDACLCGFCRAAGQRAEDCALCDDPESLATRFFVKQLGGARPGTKLEDLPEDLRIREFPTPVERAA